MDLGLRDRVALVTGASQGIGRGIAAALVTEGARVAIASRSQERIAATAEEIGARAYVFDADEPTAAPGLVDRVEADLGPIDVYVANTGGPPAGPDPLGFTREQWFELLKEGDHLDGFIDGHASVLNAFDPQRRVKLAILVAGLSK